MSNHDAAWWCDYESWREARDAGGNEAFVRHYLKEYWIEREAKMDKSPDLTSEMNIWNIEGLKLQDVRAWEEQRRQARAQERPYAMQGASGDGKVRRPMTETEEKVVERALRLFGVIKDARNKSELEANLRVACELLGEEREPPKPMTPEERAVIEAAKALAGERRIPFSAEDVAAWNSLREAVRRLP